MHVRPIVQHLLIASYLAIIAKQFLIIATEEQFLTIPTRYEYIGNRSVIQKLCKQN